MPRRLSWLVLSVLLLTGWSESYAQETGLLLGLRYNQPITKPLPYYAGSADSLSRATYSTVLISKANDSVISWTEKDNLLIPRPGGFWRVGTKRSVYNDWVEDFIWAVPDGTPRTLAGIQPFNGEYCEGHRKQTILYAGPEYLSIDQRSAGYCEGAAHPWFFNTLAVVPLDSTTHTGFTITEILGEAAYETLTETAQSFLSDFEDEDQRNAYIEEPDAANWGLVHQTGRWTALGRLEAAEEARQNIYADLPLAFELPSSLTGPPPPFIDPEHIQAFAPDALDLFIAPDQAWLLILHPDHITVHPLGPDTIGAAVSTLPVVPGTRIVMGQWATGTQLEGWIRHFERLAQSGGS